MRDQNNRGNNRGERDLGRNASPGGEENENKNKNPSPSSTSDGNSSNRNDNK